jgi:hypothetical protein
MMLRERGGGEQRAGEAPAGCGVAREEQGRKSPLLVLRQSDEVEGEEVAGAGERLPEEEERKIGGFLRQIQAAFVGGAAGGIYRVEAGRKAEGDDVSPSPENGRNTNPYRPCVRTAGMGGYNDHGGAPATADDAGHPRYTCQVLHLTLRGAMLRARSPEHGAGRVLQEGPVCKERRRVRGLNARVQKLRAKE